ncbi:hypothetical protein GCM10008982_16200 [Anoxybacillus voinovskiensis]|nr:hypothetical protein GCM10008982_16200 [Anoxybacillus voinovskiensis]
MVQSLKNIKLLQYILKLAVVRVQEQAVIKTSTVLKTPSGTSMQYFTVEDMGDVFCSRGLTRQWFDIYFGYTSSDINQANLFGIKTVSYTVTY